MNMRRIRYFIDLIDCRRFTSSITEKEPLSPHAEDAGSFDMR